MNFETGILTYFSERRDGFQDFGFHFSMKTEFFKPLKFVGDDFLGQFFRSGLELNYRVRSSLELKNRRVNSYWILHW